MIRLAIETATHACSVALQADGEIHQRYAMAPRRHGELILPWVDELLAAGGYRRSQLQAVALSRGPGSFTSLRLGLSAGAAIAFALDIPVYPVSTLAAVAWSGHQRHGWRHMIAALDARMDEVYIAAYSVTDDGLQPRQPEQLIAPAQYRPPAGEVAWSGVGNGFAAQEHALSAHLQHHLPQAQELAGCDTDCWPTAAAVLALADTVTAVAAEDFQPVYLRERVAQPAPLRPA